MMIKKVISPPRSEGQEPCRGSRDVERGGKGMDPGSALLPSDHAQGDQVHEDGGQGEVCGRFRVGHRQKARVRRTPDWLLVQWFLEENEGRKNSSRLRALREKGHTIPDKCCSTTLDVGMPCRETTR